MSKFRQILIIDDDEVCNFVTRYTLEPLKVCEEIITLLNTRQAIDYFDRSKNGLSDLVLLDINMPMINGFDFLEWYQKSQHSGKTKFIMYTTSIRKEDRNRASQYKDVIGYIEKPISERKIKKFIF